MIISVAIRKCVISQLQLSSRIISCRDIVYIKNLKMVVVITFEGEWTVLSTHSYLSFINSIKFSIICAFNHKQKKFKYVYFTIINETQLLTLFINAPKKQFCISIGFKEKLLWFKRCWTEKVKTANILTLR